MLRLVMQGVMDVLWPPRTRCLVCEEPLAGCSEPAALICDDCLNSMEFTGDEPRCANCTRPTYEPDGLCPECAAGSPYGVVFSLGPHTGALREAVHHVKFHDRQALAAVLGRRLARRISVRHDCIIPVPLHRTRLAERGYNQAAIVAAEIARLKGVPMYDRELVRLRRTGHQAKLDRRRRMKNLRGAFGPARREPAFAGKRVLLVDDVLTTGATAAAVADALYRGGAAGVDLAVLGVSTTSVKGKQKTHP